MYLRFVISGVATTSRASLGLFQAASWLRRRELLSSYDEVWLDELSCWFNENLDKPTRFGRSRDARGQQRGVCWFKSTASKHIAKMYEMRCVLERNDSCVRAWLGPGDPAISFMKTSTRSWPSPLPI